MRLALRYSSWLCLLLLSLAFHALGAQAPGEIHGRLVESGTGGAVASGAVTALRASDGQQVAGTLPAADGSFKLTGLPVGRYTVRVRSLGFTPVVRSDVVLASDSLVVDLGTITLTRVAARLGTQVVTGERAEVQLAPDRNIYSTRNMVTASGGTAIDVLRNVPAVEVDASNQVSLRGNQGVVVQINGRVSPLKGEQLGNFLAQLPASSIKRVEVATNPSAKDDPEGTAGIINIVLNQDTELGLSGGVNLGAGSTGQLNASGNVGRQQGKLIWLVSYGLFANHQQTAGYLEQTNLTIATPAFVRSRIAGRSKPLWQNGMLRTEYRFTPHDALSLDAMLSGGRFNRDNSSYYTDLDETGDVIGLFDQFNNGSSRNVNVDYDLAFRRTGNATDRTFSTELALARNWSEDATDLWGVVHQGDASTGAAPMPAENDLSHQRYPSLTWQGDFAQPFGSGSKLDAGFKENLRHSSSDFSAALLDTASGAFVSDPARASAFDYREQIGAVYALLSQRVAKVQAQAGLRVEEAGTRLGLPLAPADSQRFDNHYTSLYPSGILSYHFTQTRQAKLSYSRRVSRPYPQQLSPVVYHQDARTLFRGNPNLHPEYTDAVELGFQDSY
ncbi:MAG TPA: TonB-dependent receptor, partial [Gemmatimonadaceae bacterium]|nr:TonB-dependent receptor [Gemmatimonadaceae bacterium]